MTDLKDVINDYVRKQLVAANGNRDKFFDVIVRTSDPWPHTTGIEDWLETHHIASMVPVPPQAFYEAPCMWLCGTCVGVDKIGHFFELGLIYGSSGSRMRGG